MTHARAMQAMLLVQTHKQVRETKAGELIGEGVRKELATMLVKQLGVSRSTAYRLIQECLDALGIAVPVEAPVRKRHPWRTYDSGWLKSPPRQYLPFQMTPGRK